MSSSYAKIIAEKWNVGRDITEIRKRNSTKFKELRRSKRSAVLNQFRKGLIIVEDRPKKSVAEQKLERLQKYKTDKQKKMEDLKKKQKPPFYSIVKTRHTGGTPFRETGPGAVKVKPPLKNPVTSFSSAANTRSRAQVPFKFKATLTDINIANKKNAASKSSEKPDVIKPNQAKKVPFPNLPLSNPAQKSTLKPPYSTKKVTSSTLTSNNSKGKEPIKPVALKKSSTDKENKLSRPQRTVQTRTNVPKPPTISKTKNIIEAPSGKTNNLKGRGTNKKVDIPNEKKNGRKNGSANGKLIDVTNSVNNGTNNVSSRTTRQTNRNLISPTEANIKPPKKEKSFQEEVKKQSPKINDPSLESSNNKNSLNDENTRGAEFHRMRLKSEISRLTDQADSWSSRQEEDIPELIKDEILAVVGQTRLLLSQKFRDFKNLIDRCECGVKKDEAKVTLEDLEGFWDMMYQQVIQLDKKYCNLKELEGNNWQEKIPVKSNNASKRIVQKKKPQKQASSKFREFLKSKKQSTVDDVGPPKTPEKFSGKCDNIDDLSFYHSAKKDVESCEIPDVLKTPKNISGVERVMNDDRSSRRSSAGLIILRQRLLMKSLSSPHKKTD